MINTIKSFFRWLTSPIEHCEQNDRGDQYRTPLVAAGFAAGAALAYNQADNEPNVSNAVAIAEGLAVVAGTVAIQTAVNCLTEQRPRNIAIPIDAQILDRGQQEVQAIP